MKKMKLDVLYLQINKSKVLSHLDIGESSQLRAVLRFNIQITIAC